MSTEVGYFINLINKTKICLFMMHISTHLVGMRLFVFGFFVFFYLAHRQLGDACCSSKISQCISENKLIFILTHPFTISDFSTFLQFTWGIQASNGEASESQVVGQKKGNSVISVMVAESKVQWRQIQNPINWQLSTIIPKAQTVTCAEVRAAVVVTQIIILYLIGWLFSEDMPNVCGYVGNCFLDH